MSALKIKHKALEIRINTLKKFNCYFFSFRLFPLLNGSCASELFAMTKTKDDI